MVSPLSHLLMRSYTHMRVLYPPEPGPARQVSLRKSEAAVPQAVEYAHTVKDRLAEVGLRVEVDPGKERLAKQIRNAEQEKVPVFGIIGNKVSPDADMKLMPVSWYFIGIIGIRSSRGGGGGECVLVCLWSLESRGAECFEVRMLQEVETGTITIRTRLGGQLGAYTVDELEQGLRKAVKQVLPPSMIKFAKPMIHINSSWIA
jgi:histidyl-tRNA synthetase